MALIHQTLYESKDFAKVDFRNFLDSLLPALVSSYSLDRDRVTLSVSAGEVSLPIDAAIPCGLIVNELISNALKHAFPGSGRGRIDVSLNDEPNGEIVLSVTDNGVGIPADLDLANATTLGLQLVSLLADQLAGKLTVNRSNPTSFRLQFTVRT